MKKIQNFKIKIILFLQLIEDFTNEEKNIFINEYDNYIYEDSDEEENFNEKFKNTEGILNKDKIVKNSNCEFNNFNDDKHNIFKITAFNINRDNNIKIKKNNNFSLGQNIQRYENKISKDIENILLWLYR